MTRLPLRHAVPLEQAALIQELAFQARPGKRLLQASMPLEELMGGDLGPVQERHYHMLDCGGFQIDLMFLAYVRTIG